MNVLQKRDSKGRTKAHTNDYISQRVESWLFLAPEALYYVNQDTSWFSSLPN